MPLGVSDPCVADTSRLGGTSAVAPVDVAVATGPPLVRDVVSRALRARLGLCVVAFDADADGSIDRLLELQPRIILTDDRDSVSNSEAFIRRLLRASPLTKILVLSRRSDKTALRRFVRAGAYGILANRSDLASLVRAVEATCQGRACEMHFGAEKTAKYPAALRRNVVSPPDADRRLTKREWEIAELVAKGLRNRSIALRLNISVDTVKTHLNNSFRKLEVDGRLALGMLIQSRMSPKENMTCGA